MKFDFFAYLAGKLVVDGVPRTGGDDASLDGFAYQCQVADDIQQFVRFLKMQYLKLLI